jgi:hypothetical protein
VSDNPQEQSFAKAFAPVLLRLFFGLALGLIISEIVLAVLNIPEFHQAHSSPPQFTFAQLENGELFYVNKPSSKIEFIYDSNPRGYFDDNNSVVQTTNSLGFRGNEFEKEKSENTIRIAFLGDSFTFGEGVKDEDIFTRKLERNLNENSQEIKYEIYNFGVGGYNTQQSVFLFKNMVLEFKPDIVVLDYTLNDAEPKLFYVDQEANSVQRRAREVSIHEGLADNRPPDNIFYKFRATKLFWQVNNNRKLTEQTINYYNSLYENGNPNWQKTREALQEFAHICAENEIDCYFVLFPLLFQLDENYPFQQLHDKVKKVVEPTGIPIIEVLPVLQGREYSKLWVHPTDQHPNEVVHGLTAQLLLEKIL